jgi:DNA invertase Pin-like site-specific DNA recombinase
MTSSTLTPAVIYLRLSDFRDQTDDTFEARKAELEEFAASLGLRVVWVAIENDLNGDGKPKGASAFKTPVKITTPNGLVEFRTDRPRWQEVIRDYLLTGRAKVLVVSDDSRLARNERDGLDLIDAARVSKASVVAPDETWEPRWILRDGGSDAEQEALRDRIADARRYSASVRAKVKMGRRRWAGKSYQGGRRPFGYQVQEHTAQHQRNLVIDEDEALELRQAAFDLLHGVSLAAVERGLIARGVATVTGGPWSTRTIRDMLLTAAVVGQQVRAGERVDAPWEAIISQPDQDRLRDLLTDPSRRTHNGGNEPRWLVSCFAQCGICQGQLKVGGAGRGRSPAYVGSTCGHVRRQAKAVDDLISDLIIARLEEPDAADLLKPPPALLVDGEALRAERATLRRQRQALLAVFEGDSQAQAEIDRKAARLSQIETQLTTSSQPDPLEEFRGQPARTVWEGLSMARRRAVVQLLLAQVVILRAERKGSAFDPETIRVRWVEEALAA